LGGETKAGKRGILQIKIKRRQVWRNLQRKKKPQKEKPVHPKQNERVITRKTELQGGWGKKRGGNPSAKKKKARRNKKKCTRRAKKPHPCVKKSG